MLENNKKFDLTNTSHEEQKVLELLDEKGDCLYGNILKELKIAYTTGAEIIQSLTHKGYIKQIDN